MRKEALHGMRGHAEQLRSVGSGASVFEAEPAIEAISLHSDSPMFAQMRPDATDVSISTQKQASGTASSQNTNELGHAASLGVQWESTHSVNELTTPLMIHAKEVRRCVRVCTVVVGGRHLPLLVLAGGPPYTLCRRESVPGDQNLTFLCKLVPKAKQGKKMQITSWRCFKNCGIIRFGLMCKQMAQMAHEYASHRSRARASLNSRTSLKYYLNWHLRTYTLTSLRWLSMSIFKINFWHVLVKLEIPSYLRMLT